MSKDPLGIMIVSLRARKLVCFFILHLSPSHPFFPCIADPGLSGGGRLEPVSRHCEVSVLGIRKRTMLED